MFFENFNYFSCLAKHIGFFLFRKYFFKKYIKINMDAYYNIKKTMMRVNRVFINQNIYVGMEYLTLRYRI